MTEQLYRRRAGEPVRVWEVGTEPVPEWVGECVRTFFNPGNYQHSLRQCIERYAGLLLIEKMWPPQPAETLARDYEPVPPAPDAAIDSTLTSLPTAVREQLEEGAGFWRTCSGCHETSDGYNVGRYPHSATFGCTLGGGCSECGGIGAIWDNADYETISADTANSDPAPDAREALERIHRALMDPSRPRQAIGEMVEATLARMGGSDAEV